LRKWEFPNFVGNCPEKVYKLMLKMWDESAERRPTFAECYEVLEKYYKEVHVEEVPERKIAFVPQSENYN
jgi:hypothetical protein